jgi:hypothetical protein
MNIPLNRLYHYIENIAQEIYGDPIIIYRFWPHGSKNINDLNPLNDYRADQNCKEWVIRTTYPSAWCNDQEPLDYDFYSKNLLTKPDDVFSLLLKSNGLYQPSTNLNYRKQSIFKKNILLHSERRSENLNKYQLANELIPVYYWSHAVIARDWFRYAKHESFHKNTTKTFLIYNRAWSNTREYRLKFTDLLIENDLIEHCQITCNSIDPELNVHYANHRFKNPVWKPINQLENYVGPSTANSTSSADFDTDDYNSTEIEVVLETMFDDSRLHLTEKSLRPVACGQPFILAGTHGSLEYLRGYGFKTFGNIWDEQYDTIENPKDRLIKITELMQCIANWSAADRKNKLAQARAIAEYNRQHFFSQEFFNQVVNELKTNLATAFAELDNPKNYKIDYWNKLAATPEIIDFVSANQEIYWPTKTDLEYVLSVLGNKTQ